MRQAQLREAARYDAFGRVLALQVRVAEGTPPTPAQALGAINSLSTYAGMEQLWLTVQLASRAKSHLREALRTRASEVGAQLVEASPAELQERVRRHNATLLD